MMPPSALLGAAMILFARGRPQRFSVRGPRGALEVLAARIAAASLLLGAMVLPPLAACDFSLWLGCRELSRAACLGAFTQALLPPELMVAGR